MQASAQPANDELAHRSVTAKFRNVLLKISSITLQGIVPRLFWPATPASAYGALGNITKFLLLALTLALSMGATRAATLDRATLASHVEPPNELGEKLNDDGVWSIIVRTGNEAGYIFETGSIAPLPGFSGAPINVLVTLNPEGKFLRADLLEHNEPVFVSGLGEAPFHEFMRQYNGLSIFDTLGRRR